MKTHPPQNRERPLTLEIDSLTKSYGDTTVVDGLTFTVQPGRVTGFLGPNGSGNSTTMKMLLGLASADKGRATIGGTPYRNLADPARTLGVVLEPNAFHPGRSGRNHLRIQAEAAGIPAAQVDDVLRAVDLSPEAANRRVGTYSLGMKQRLSLALALLGDPPVLVLDEPGNGLDPRGIRTLRDNLTARAANGDTVFVSSHLLSEVEQLADDLVVIDEGRLVAAGPFNELRKPTALVRTTAPDELAVALRRIGGEVTHRDADRRRPLDRRHRRTRLPRGCHPPRAVAASGVARGDVHGLDQPRVEHQPIDINKEGGRRMTNAKLVRSEIRRLTTTRMPLAFLAVLGAMAALNAAIVAWGSDADGTQTFLSTALDQKSLVAFSANSIMIAGLFGATAVARGYGHGTVVHVFLATPRRLRASLAQFAAVALGGAVLGLAWFGAVHQVLPFWHMANVLRDGLTSGLVDHIARSYAVLTAWLIAAWGVTTSVVTRRG